MNTRWHQSVEAAAKAFDTPMPWTRGAIRQAMIQRREAREDEQSAAGLLEKQPA